MRTERQNEDAPENRKARLSDETAVLLTLVVYKMVLVAIGIATRRRTRDAAEFFLGGRRLGSVTTDENQSSADICLERSAARGSPVL